MKAILISGFENKKGKKGNMTPEFIRDCKSFARYLISKVGLRSNDVSFFKPAEIKTINLWGLFECIRATAGSYPNEPLIIYYSGHGERGHWNLRANRKKGERSYHFKLRRLLRVLHGRSAPLIVIADCCYGMALMRWLKKLSCPWLLLGLAPETRVGYGSVWGQIQLFWSKRRLAFPKYDNGNKLVKVIKIKSFNKKLYGFKYGDGKHYPKFFFSFRYKRVKMVLRAGSDLDHLMYPKK